MQGQRKNSQKELRDLILFAYEGETLVKLMELQCDKTVVRWELHNLCLTRCYYFKNRVYFTKQSANKHKTKGKWDVLHVSMHAKKVSAN